VSPRTGRRPGDSGTRQAILDAARGRFATLGFHRATIRAIAQDAAVDPALVHHYFGTKRELFVAAVELPFRPGEVLPGLLAGDRDRLGERLVGLFLAAMDRTPDRSPAMSLLRTAVADERAASTAREVATETILGPVARALGGGDAELRAALAASQMTGLLLTRYIVRLEPLASAPADDVARLVGPTLQRYLAGDLA
jgi:AcrR family transcriptional regulator